MSKELEFIKMFGGGIDFDEAFTDYELDEIASVVKAYAQPYKELCKQLRDALDELMKGVVGLPSLTAIVGVLERQYKKGEEVLLEADNLLK
jgi:hypothetical protein